VKLFDVLSTVTWTGSTEEGIYWVQTVQASDERRAKQIARRSMAAWFYEHGRELRTCKVLYAAPVGTFDHMANKSVGSFIEAAGMGND